MIIVERLKDNKVRYYSDIGMKIRQVETGNLYDDAVDSVPHEYEETDIPVDSEEITAEEALEIIIGGIS